jgi:hypothetical protein
VEINIPCPRGVADLSPDSAGEKRPDLREEPGKDARLLAAGKRPEVWIFCWRHRKLDAKSCRVFRHRAQAQPIFAGSHKVCRFLATRPSWPGTTDSTSLAKSILPRRSGAGVAAPGSTPRDLNAGARKGQKRARFRDKPLGEAFTAERLAIAAALPRNARQEKTW